MGFRLVYRVESKELTVKLSIRYTGKVWQVLVIGFALLSSCTTLAATAAYLVFGVDW